MSNRHPVSPEKKKKRSNPATLARPGQSTMHTVQPRPHTDVMLLARRIFFTLPGGRSRSHDDHESPKTVLVVYYP
ncbi:hypothetical protein NUU61_004894 [Penicillium alfredii]|uniref:Uncharacterized protein n=1 Tax=Penicillium alfredii TaxID=1506179 RepID=A0A9W9F8E9_9EURO|nr:uncharacterized protein NUU61_004894 [Penicillium alfredii]KAJ5095538.1 hypothetical protein NUU61_004894 [Penicillium alfredii]